MSCLTCSRPTRNGFVSPRHPFKRQMPLQACPCFSRISSHALRYARSQRFVSWLLKACHREQRNNAEFTREPPRHPAPILARSLASLPVATLRSTRGGALTLTPAAMALVRIASMGPRTISGSRSGCRKKSVDMTNCATSSEGRDTGAQPPPISLHTRHTATLVETNAKRYEPASSRRPSMCSRRLARWWQSSRQSYPAQAGAVASACNPSTDG